MSCKFLIIQENINTINFLKSVITHDTLGNIVEILQKGKYASEEILFYKPDLVILDYNIGKKNALEIVQEVHSQEKNITFVLFSYEHDEDIISKSFKSGIRFFIRNPITYTEMYYTLKEICNHINLEKTLSIIKGALSNTTEQRPTAVLDLQTQISSVLTDLGIISESGTRDLIRTIEIICEHKRRGSRNKYQLQDIYIELSQEKYKENSQSINTKSIEQRIRRSILKSLHCIAQLGIDDYYNGKFNEYSTRLFDFKQVKQEMLHIKDPNQSRGKVNIKKFIEGIMSYLNF
ncbi:MAG: response regulator [Anaeromicrobium sp.]|jgi:two-component system response regulator YcbB|uniref:response regulator n=1 Tax=Anaeromicrobium sp. TaxID=1929132 RepID=UPI0025E55F93|nr:response regulator [Anaeromicrobium sp.]MCT4593372.1 response regulator [Anaeromicrobium sp.]